MAHDRHNLVVGVFDHQAPAEQAVLELWQAGFAHDRVDMVTRSQGVTKATPDLQRQKDAADGALTGAVAGVSAGAVAGAIAFALVPGIGAAIGGGLLATVIGGACLGAAGGTFLGPFIALQMDEDEAHYYAHQVDEGRTVVLVQTENRVPEARVILRKYGGRERADVSTAATAR